LRPFGFRLISFSGLTYVRPFGFRLIRAGSLAW